MEVRGSARKKGDSSGCMNTIIANGILPHHTWVPILRYQNRSRVLGALTSYMKQAVRARRAEGVKVFD